MQDPPANLIAAACATASWARARRAAWTNLPLAVLPAAPAIAAPAIPEAAATPAEAADATRAAGPSPLGRLARSGWSTAASVAALVSATRMRALGAMVWGRRALLLSAALLGATVAGGLYWSNAPATPREKEKEPGVVLKPLPVRPAVGTHKGTGGLRVTSTPPGAQVLVDGKSRGATPLTLTDLIVGRHTVELKGDAGTVERTVIVAADKTSEIAESIFSGWLAVYSPFDLVITEGGRALHLDDRHQTMLAPGPHDLRLVNRALGYDAERQVELKPGETTSLSVTPPPSTLTVTATEAAEVWLDGTRVGEVPVNSWSVALGSHEIVVKRPVGAERRFTITITVKPYTLNVDFSQPAA
jgi:hypothetical protein